MAFTVSLSLTFYLSRVPLFVVLHVVATLQLSHVAPVPVPVAIPAWYHTSTCKVIGVCVILSYRRSRVYP